MHSKSVCVDAMIHEQNVCTILFDWALMVLLHRSQKSSFSSSSASMSMLAIIRSVSAFNWEWVKGTERRAGRYEKGASNMIQSTPFRSIYSLTCVNPARSSMKLVGSFIALRMNSSPSLQYAFNIGCEHAVHLLNASPRTGTVAKRVKKPRNWCGTKPKPTDGSLEPLTLVSISPGAWRLRL